MFICVTLLRRSPSDFIMAFQAAWKKGAHKTTATTVSDIRLAPWVQAVC